MKKFFVGIDFSKRRMDVSIVEKDFPEQAIAYKQFANNAEGANEMCNWVERTTNASTKHDGEVLFCCEHTGSYCLEVCDYLSENGKYIWLGNPLDIKRSMGLVRGKDDVIDSRRIATFAAEKHHKAVLYMRPEDSTRTLKYLLSIRNTLIEQKKALSCQIKENFPKLHDAALLCKIENELKHALDFIKAEIKKIEKMMLDIILSNKEYKHTFDILTSMKGVALINAAAIIVLRTISRGSHSIPERYAPIGVLRLSETNQETVSDVVHTQAASTTIGSKPSCQRLFYVPSDTMND